MEVGWSKQISKERSNSCCDNIQVKWSWLFHLEKKEDTMSWFGDHYPQLKVNFTHVKVTFVCCKNYPEIGVNITLGFFCVSTQYKPGISGWNLAGSLIRFLYGDTTNNFHYLVSNQTFYCPNLTVFLVHWVH